MAIAKLSWITYNRKRQYIPEAKSIFDTQFLCYTIFEVVFIFFTICNSQEKEHTQVYFNIALGRTFGHARTQEQTRCRNRRGCRRSGRRPLGRPPWPPSHCIRASCRLNMLSCCTSSRRRRIVKNTSIGWWCPSLNRTGTSEVVVFYTRTLTLYHRNWLRMLFPQQWSHPRWALLSNQEPQTIALCSWQVDADWILPRIFDSASCVWQTRRCNVFRSSIT
jgi:hypothetical protein